MQVEINSIWEIRLLDEVPDSLYRVLSHSPETGHIILFDLRQEKKLKKPTVIQYDIFLEGIKDGKCIASSYKAPFYQLLTEEDLPQKYKNKRDKNWSLIKDLVNDPVYLPNIVSGGRSSILVNYARDKGTYVQKVYRLLNLYWQFGQHPNALLPAYKKSGAVGVERVAGEKKRGAPLKSFSPGIENVSGKNITDKDKLIFKKAMRKFGFLGQQVKLTRIYDKMLKEFYADQILDAESLGVEPCLPSFRSFRYWVKRLFTADEVVRKQTTKGDYERNRRALGGSATDHTEVIGSCFEIDATVIDVHVVSEFNRNIVLGRPTLYCVVDKESRMITGIHVSLEHASWRAGRQALVNSFTPKKDYCSRFGIEISEDEWPCHHIPQRLLCDRGEFICKKPEKLALPLIGHISIAPPYRPDLKGIVERFFGTLNNKLFHEVKGSTRGQHRKRGENDPRLSAQLTIAEVTRLLIDEVLEHNNHKTLDRLGVQSQLLVESSLAPTPLNYWNVHFDCHRHALSIVNEAEVRAQLLPPEKVSMTGEGLRLSDTLYYEADHENFEQWKVEARNNGRWTLEARVDQDNSSFIYVRLQPEAGFTKCKLLLRSSNFKEKHIADVHYFQGWLKNEKKRNTPSSKSIERHRRRTEIESGAADSQKALGKPKTKKTPIENMKSNRKQAIEQNRAFTADYQANTQESHERESTTTSFDNVENVVSILKRARRNRNED